MTDKTSLLDDFEEFCPRCDEPLDVTGDRWQNGRLEEVYAECRVCRIPFSFDMVVGGCENLAAMSDGLPNEGEL